MKNKKTIKKDYSMFLDEMVFSYSRVNAYLTCPKCFYLQYIRCLKGDAGFFGQFGTLCHSLLEKYANGGLEAYELSAEYKKQFDMIITCVAPPNKFVDLRNKYFEAGLDFFNNFEGYEGSNILGVENKYKFKVDKYKFVGSLDLEVDDIIVDYKTKSEIKGIVTRFNKNHNKDNYVTLLDGRYLPFSEMIQLLLYCIPYYEKHKKYPSTIVLDMIKIQDRYEIKFQPELLERAKQWVIDTIALIYEDVDFLKNAKCDDHWCSYTCNQRYNCEHSDRYVK